MAGLSIRNLYKATYLYLALPLFVFILTWLDLWAATLFALVFSFAFYKLWKGIGENNDIIHSSLFWLAIGFAVFWCFFAGIGYFYYQSWDYHFRNAVFRDLIFYDWPVFYNRANTPLVYYMGFWLIPALFGKLILLLGGKLTTAFFIGNIFLFLYAVLGLALIFIHIGVALKVNNGKQLILASFIFMFFSGLDIIGYLFFQQIAQPFDYHLDWWATFIQYSSMATGIFWVFNQFIMVGLILLLIYNERAVKSFGFLMPLALFFAPYPTASLGILAITYALSCWLKSTNRAHFFWQDLLSIPNLLGVFWLLPLVILYFITNSEGMDKLWYVFDYITPSRLFLFMVLEFLLYTAVLFRKFHKDLFFNCAIVLLVLIPFFRLDQQNNFCMRASMPTLMLLALFAVKFLFENFRDKKSKFLSMVLVLLLILGSATPLMEFYRGLHYVFEAGKINLVQDEIYTLNKRFVAMPVFGWDANHQYTAKKYKDDIFWQLLANRNIP